MPLEPWLSQLLPAALFGLMAYLLRQKDVQQERSINALWEAKRILEKEVEALKLALVGDHYKKPEVDERFNRLEYSIRDGFRDLGLQFKALSDKLISHVSHEEGRNESNA